SLTGAVAVIAASRWTGPTRGGVVAALRIASRGAASAERTRRPRAGLAETPMEEGESAVEAAEADADHLALLGVVGALSRWPTPGTVRPTGDTMNRHQRRALERAMRRQNRGARGELLGARFYPNGLGDGRL